MRSALFVAIALLIGAATGRAQADASGTGSTVVTPIETTRQLPAEWGTSTATIEVMDAMAFAPHLPGTSWTTAAGWMKVCTGSPCTFFHSVDVPSGAQVVAIEIEGCDNDGSADMVMHLLHCHSGACDEVPDASGVSTSGAPGCNYFTRGGFAPVTVDNWNGTYVALISGTATPNLLFRGARVYYRLQVSPAPASASFPNDVPTTHPFFRFIEALAGAGITGGCGTGAYCPDSPLTRGQMAVFLATALGLHYPN